MQIQLIRSATLRISLAGSTFLIDPWLADRGAGRSYAGERMSPLVDLPMPAEQVIAGIDAVIVSHLHSDHFDEAARALLPLAMPILCAPRLVAEIEGFGFTDVRAVEGEFALGGVRIATTDGLHGPPEVLQDMGPVSGFAFHATGEPVLYWAGDSILCPEVRAALVAHKPDVVVVHACGAQWGGIGPLVMDAGMVAETLRIAPAATLVATHLDAVDHATFTRTSLRDAIVAIPDAARLVIPADGEILHFAA
jgi:L-ascorbate metabolism protein UlaG (beta-lactamase superfamily)